VVVPVGHGMTVQMLKPGDFDAAGSSDEQASAKVC
jgi:hypothetical protein